MTGKGCAHRHWRDIVKTARLGFLALAADDLANAFTHCGYANVQ
jgi:hypothetical protein